MIQNAKKYNIKFIRFSLDKFQTKERDFLIGNCDNYTNLVKEDLIYLKKVLNLFKEEKMPVVITMLSLPGVRWKQNNNNKNDFRIYQEEKFVNQAAKFWYDLVRELQEYNDIIVGYNLLNEPRFERFHNINNCGKKHQDRLFEIYKKIIAQIRKINKDAPIVLDVSSDSSCECFEYLEPLKKISTSNEIDKNIIYSFHMYEPFEYTFSSAKWNKNKVKYTNYPFAIGGKKVNKKNNKEWNKAALEKYLSVISNWQKRYNINSSQILAGEFGAERNNKGVDIYFQDLIDIFNKNKWHWAFYSFEEDTWSEMDYEMGDRKLDWKYWQDYEKCEKIKFQDKKCFNLNKRFYNTHSNQTAKDNKVWKVLLNALK